MNGVPASNYVRKYVSLTLASLLLFLCFLVIGLEESPDYPTTIVLQIHTDRNEHFQIFWRTRSQGYTQERSRRLYLKPDRTEYQIRLPDYADYNNVRLDPFQRPASITLDALGLQVGDRMIMNMTESGELRRVLKPLENSCEVEAAESGVAISSSSSDARVEIWLKSPSLFLSVYQHTLMLAFIFSFATSLFLAFLFSARYQRSAGDRFPRRFTVWLGWFLGIIFITIYLFVAIPIAPHLESTRLVYPAWLVIIATWLFILMFFLTTRTTLLSRPPPPTRFAWLLYGVPILLVFSLYILAFWPASMSPDSIDQWGQVITFDFKDWHPAFHSLTLWLITRIWESPSMAAIFQAILLAGSFGWGLSRLQAYGVPRIVLISAGLIFVLTPVNGLMAVTIWKDIPYSVAMLVLSVCLLEIALSSGDWLASRRNIFLLSLAILFVSLYRHNGILPAVAVPPLLFALYPRWWKGMVVIVLIAGGLNVLIRGPLYTYLDVNRETPLDHVVEKMQGRVARLLKGVENTDNPVNLDSASDGGSVVQESQSVNSVSAEMPEYLKSSSLLWRVKPLKDYYHRVDYVNLWGQQKEKLRIRYISGNDLGLAEDPKLPGLTKKIYELFQLSKYHGGLFWTWRPGVFLYLLLSAAMIATMRNRKLLVLPLVPLLLNSLPTLVVVSHKSIYRYHYSLVLTAFLLILPYLFVTPESSENSNY